MMFVEDFKQNSRYCGLGFFWVFWRGRLNVSAFFLGRLSVIFERDGLGVGAAVDDGVWINGEGGAVGDG